ncbi:XdhC family protein [Bacillus sp. 37MA]|uniref:XdhC family protein n=1 Tax=Bacillus sp. 37MA TaxID=1132442 RepID=UPI00035FB02F|nr:XdhC family protein [Bacillus sp. 37MA]
MESIHQILDVIHLSSQKDILATIIDVQGSAYRKEGTSMLFKEDGTRVGLLSAGCIEDDLAERVKDLFNDGLSQTIVFDMRAEDDLSWGQGAGCNGVLRVLLEPVGHRLRSHLHTLETYLEAGKSVVIMKKLTHDYSVTDYIFLTEDHQLFGEWQGSIPARIKCLLDSRPPIVKSGIIYMEELSAPVYLHHYQPKSRLIIFGAGQDAIPLVQFASKAGFSVLVSDWRPALCNKDNFPSATECIVDFPVAAIKQIHFRPDDHVIVLTHNFKRDQELLQLLANEKLGYLGVLGSRARTLRLLSNGEDLGNIRTPVGLHIGAEGPEEIAISIVADLIRVKRLQKNSKMDAMR